MSKTSIGAVVLAAGIFTAGSLHASTLMSVAYGTITGVGQQERGGPSAGAALVDGTSSRTEGPGCGGVRCEGVFRFFT